jgi:Heterokaryon incompatibility protein (HET)
MFEITHYGSLDEILERAPPIDAICLRCKGLNFVGLFSGPRYDDFGQGYEVPRLDVFVATLAQIRASADKCRICYIMIAFHDASHLHDRDCKSVFSEDGEYCILKPYRTDALLHMKDQSDGSNKETIATSLALAFPSASNFMSNRARAHRGLSNKGTGSNILTVAENMVLQSPTLSQENLPCQSDNYKVGNDVVLEAPPPRSVADEVDTDSGSEGPWTSDSESPVLGTQFPALEPCYPPYKVHNFIFSLTPGSSVGSRSALSLSDSVNGSTIDWCSLRSWVKACEIDHPGCRRDDWNLPPKGGMRIRCIDVRTSQIVAVGFETRYLTLSYVWGGANNEIPGQVGRSLVKDNSMLIVQNLPPTVRDAIKITKGLHERYLWVDCVCIDQSDKSMVQEQVNIMDRIYENSLLTLVTATSENAQDQIPGVHRNSRLKSSLDVLLEGRLMKAMCTESVVGGFFGVWESRGWTFQEWLLSRRCLFFSQDQILFRCQESSGLESFTPPVSGTLSDTGTMSHFWADPRSALLTLPRQPLGAPSWNFQGYAELVTDYTCRNLTYDNDVLHAFTGIMRKLERSCGMSFVEGLPTTDLLRALLFSGVDEVFVPSEKRRLRRPERPSWAWSAFGHQSGYFCWEVDEQPDLADCFQSVSGSRAQNPQKAGVESSVLERVSQRSVVLIVRAGSVSWRDIPPERCKAIRYRYASVELLPESAQFQTRRLLVSSETRKILVHHKPAPLKSPEYTQSEKCRRSEDSVLHPLTKKVVAGRNFAGLGAWQSPSWLFPVNAGPRGEKSFSSHDAILLYEWNIEDKDGDWNKDVVAMIIDRLDDGTVERVSLAAIRSEDWDTLPLVSEREDLILV